MLAFGQLAIDENLRFFPAWCPFSAGKKKMTIVSQPCIDWKAIGLGHFDDAKIILRDSLIKLETKVQHIHVVLDKASHAPYFLSFLLLYKIHI